MLARFGPSRSCAIALCRRSAQVKSEVSGMTKSKRRKTILPTMMARSVQIMASPSRSREAELNGQRRASPAGAGKLGDLLHHLAEDGARVGVAHLVPELLRDEGDDLPIRLGVAGR